MARGCGCSDAGALIVSTESVQAAGHGTPDSPYQLTAAAGAGGVVSVNDILPDGSGNVEVDTIPSTVGVDDGDVLTNSGGTPGWAPPTDVGPAVDAAIAAYLATDPFGTIDLNAGYLSTPGPPNGNWANALGACSITGDIDVRWGGAPLSITSSGAFRSIVSITGAFDFRQTATNGKPALWVSHDNGVSSATAGIGTATPPAGALGWRVTWVASTGQVKFYALDPAGSVTTADGRKWTQVGSTATATASGSLTPGAKEVSVGGLGPNGTEGNPLQTQWTQIYSGIDGTLALNVDFTQRPNYNASFVDATGFTWTTRGTATIVPPTGTIEKDGVTIPVVLPGAIQAAAGGPGWSRRNPLLRTFVPSDYGDLVTSDQTRRAAVQAAIDAAYAAGGGVVDLNGPQLTVGANSSVLDMLTGLPYAAIHAKDNVRLYAEDPMTGGLKLGSAQNCHLVAHPGRLNNASPSKMQDNIQGFSIRGLLLDGNRTNQDQCHDHDGLRFPQYPRLRVEDCVLQNFDGHGYYSSANGDFAQSIASIGDAANATVVKPLWLQTVSSLNNVRWGFMMSATNRKTHEKELYASGNGHTQARIVGKKPNPVISGNGSLALTIDSNLTPVSIALLAGDTASTVVTKINAVLTTTATAALSTGTNRLMITTATVGGLGWVAVDASSTTSVLLDLGLSTPAGNGPLPGTPIHLNGENNAACGGNEYGGFYADHSEADTSGWFAESNLGDGVYIHNVNLCNFAHFEMANNSGIGIVVTQMVTSAGGTWISGMNCADFGYASYRSRNIQGTGGASIVLPSCEVYFAGDASGGYGITNFTNVDTIIAPGLKSSLGAGSDNRHANAAIVIDHRNTTGLTITNKLYGDGGLNADGLGATIRDYR